jgi:predicted dehydrogenase
MKNTTSATTMKAMRVAVFGMGGMGKRHVQALDHLTVESLAVCDPRPDALTGLPHSAKTFGDWKTLLDSTQPLDLAIVATNGPSHAEIVLAAACAGVPYILCEKPMTTSGAKARQILAVCEAAGTRLAVNLSRRFTDRYRELKKVIASGAIGTVHHVSAHVGAGGLGCIGSHYFDLVEWLTGTEAVAVSGEIEKDPAPCVRGPQFFDPGGRGLVYYNNGMTAFFELSECVSIAPRLELVGTKGFVQIDEFTPPKGGSITLWKRAASDLPNTRWVAHEPQTLPVKGPIDVVECCRRCIADLVDAHQEQTASAAVRNVDTVMAFHLSSRKNGERIELPLTGTELDLEVAIT